MLIEFTSWHPFSAKIIDQFLLSFVCFRLGPACQRPHSTSATSSSPTTAREATAEPTTNGPNTETGNTTLLKQQIQPHCTLRVGVCASLPHAKKVVNWYPNNDIDDDDEQRRVTTNDERRIRRRFFGSSSYNRDHSVVRRLTASPGIEINGVGNE